MKKSDREINLLDISQTEYKSDRPSKIKTARRGGSCDTISGCFARAARRGSCAAHSGCRRRVDHRRTNRGRTSRGCGEQGQSANRPGKFILIIVWTIRMMSCFVCRFAQETTCSSPSSSSGHISRRT